MLVMIAPKDVIDEGPENIEEYSYHYNQIAYPVQLLNDWLKRSITTHRGNEYWRQTMTRNAVVKGTPDQEAAYAEEQRVWELENDESEFSGGDDY
jgi:hypothetical protein